MIDRETPLAKIVGQIVEQMLLSRIVILDNICPTISASGVSLSIIIIIYYYNIQSSFAIICCQI